MVYRGGGIKEHVDRPEQGRRIKENITKKGLDGSGGDCSKGRSSTKALAKGTGSNVSAESVSSNGGLVLGESIQSDVSIKLEKARKD